MKKILVVLFCISFQTVFCQSNAKKVLFVGNSYTFYFDMPGLVKSCALSTNDTLETDQNTISGYTLKQHASNTTTTGKIKQGGFDHVILQANSLEFTYDDNTVATNTLPYAYYLDSLAHAHNPCAQTIFYTTWGRKSGSNGQTYLQQDTLIEKRYKAMANLKQAMLSPAGPVRRYLRTNSPGIELYDADLSHPSAAGSYVSAVCFYTVIFRKDPTLITYNAGLSAADANAIKQAVKTVLYNDFSQWNIGAFDPSLPIADFNSSTTETTLSLANTSQHAASYAWSFGDASSSVLFAPSHTYSLSGTYTVALTASYCKSSSTISKTVTVSSAKPIVTNITQNPQYVYPNVPAGISARITDDVGVVSATLYWGTSSGSLTNTITMNASGAIYSATIPGQAVGTTVYYRVEATDGNSNTTVSTQYSYTIQDIVVTISPSLNTINRNAQQQFTVVATDLNGNTVSFVPTWSSSAGTISSSGLFTAPSTPGTYTITAVQNGLNGTGTAQINVSPVPVIAGKIEAEKYVLMSGIQNEATTDLGGGQDVAYIDANDWMSYEVNVLKTGTYQIEFRLASTISNVQMELFTGASSLGVLTLPTATGGWQNWQTVTMNVSLAQGVQTLKLKANTGGFNINWMNFSEVIISLGINDTDKSVSSESGMLPMLASPNPFSNRTVLYFGTHEEKQIHVFSMHGALEFQTSSAENSLELGEELKSGIYFIVITGKNKRSSIKIQKL